MSIPVITIDGPSGVGKGSLCKALANKLKWHFLDSGVIYRSLALLALEHKVSFNNERQLVALASYMRINFVTVFNGMNIFLNGKEVQEQLYSENIAIIASLISTLPQVRETLLYLQRSFQMLPGLIADGRDMGTVVFPKAGLKFFLYASCQERGKRRILQLQKKGFNVNLNNLLMNMQERDLRDRKRFMSPLLPAIDAFFIDSTFLTENEVRNKVLMYIKNFLGIQVDF